ncbi:prolyl oligopeptidase family protein [Artemisia annua]|uniref:Prolyl oligopeptidase family protein n=1 Tax=Artemisia annua TaxID=35608 RepID=A0A2U1MBX3_ARTAN|nr:prolyl oligopeptidase family protein [Artemisia annua]
MRMDENTHGGGDDQGSLLSWSMRLEVPKFNGTDPERWIFAIYEYFDLIATPNEQQIQIVAFNLEGDVTEWFRWMSQARLEDQWLTTSIAKGDINSGEPVVKVLRHDDLGRIYTTKSCASFHGMSVLDPYRWLEDPKLEEVHEFVKKEVELTEYVLKKFETQEKLHDKLTKFYDYQKFAAPFREADKYFYFHNSGLQPQKVMDMQDSLDGKAEVLSEDGTIALSTYALSSSGSDWVTVQGMWIDGKKVEPDTLSWVKMSDVEPKREATWM